MRSKEDRLSENFSLLIQEFMAGKGYSPMTPRELTERLNIPDIHQRVFNKVINTLVKEGIVKRSNGRLATAAAGPAPEVVVGVIRVHPRGFGFVIPESPSSLPDIFIPRHLTCNAVDGDTVEAAIAKESYGDKGPEGRVIAVLKRARTHVGGTVRIITRQAVALVYAPILGSSQLVRLLPSEEYNPQVGDRVIMKVHDWGSQNTETVCEFSHYIGHISDPSCDVRAAIEEFGLRHDFSLSIQKEAKSFGTRVNPADLEGREDLRELETVTIDPDTAKDFDDALSLSKDPQGRYHLAVHIADVTHYLQAGAALDHEASRRCNSTYFPGVCVPMLPEQLSSNLCSLKPGVNRLAITVFLTFDAEGRLLKHRFSRSVIRSNKRLTYREAKAILEGKKRSTHAPTLKLMQELCLLLKERRKERGSVEFALPEVVVLVDDNGTPENLDRVEYDITHQLVEEFMLKANETVARHLNNQGKSITYRVHEEPAPENIEDFVSLASAFGFNLPSQPTGFDFQKFFEEAEKTTFYDYLATCYIRCMTLASYSPENVGHFGLSLEHYCHFTSPIRRYADVVVHRSLMGDDLPAEELHRVAERCSEQERLSARAENSVKLLKKLRLLDVELQKNRRLQLDAVVTRVKPFGIAFEVIDYMTEGFLHVSALQEDYYEFDDRSVSLVGYHTDRRFICGDNITVSPKRIDLITLEVDWDMVHHSQRQTHQKKPSQGKKRRKHRR